MLSQINTTTTFIQELEQTDLTWANSVEPDHMPQNADQALHCLALIRQALDTFSLPSEKGSSLKGKNFF